MNANDIKPNDGANDGKTDLLGLIEHIGQLAAGVTAEELQTLGQLHTLLEDAAVAFDVRGNADAAKIARGGVVRLGQVMLCECADSAAALGEVRDVILKLASCLTVGGTTPAMVTPSGETPAVEPPAAEKAAHDAIGAEATLNPEDLPLVQEFVSEATSHLDAAEAMLLTLEHNPSNADAVGAVFRSFHTIKGVAGFLNFKQIGALAHVAENLLDLARQGKLRIHGPVADVVFAATDTMRALVASVVTAVNEQKPVAVYPGLTGLIERLKRAARGEESQVAEETEADRRSGDERRTAERRTVDAAGDGTVKVATARLDNLINMVGELVITQSMVSQEIAGSARGNQRLTRNLSQLGKITRELQDLSMAMRMVPVQGVFQKMTRLARDLGQKAGKQLELVITGGETELDRNVVEAIGDPLIHMVRNSADHGIEPADEREKACKPRAGRIELRAEHSAGAIRIQITDDGRGLNRDRIVKKAIAAGIVREGQELSDQDAFKLIFHAGLSTAEKITDISGRGVGMDVVKRNIEALRGRIEISSALGKGTTFTIWLPLTLAVIDGLLVRVGSHRYILPITSIERSLRPRAEQISTVQGRGEMCLIRGDLLPMFRLHRLFNVRPVNEDPAKALVVIVRDNERQCSLLVDELLGQQQVVIKSLGDGIGHVPGVSGGAILGDGNVCLILDVPGLIDLAGTQAQAPRAKAPPLAPAA